MNKVLINDTTLFAIGDAIREKNGSTDTYKPSEMPTAILSITTGGGDTTIEDGLIQRTIIGQYTNNRVTTVESYAFFSCYRLTEVNMSNVTTIGSNAFNGCTGLTTVNMPNVTSIEKAAFSGCKLTGELAEIFPNITTIEEDTFYRCNNITSVNMPNVTSVGQEAFSNCLGLITVNLSNVTSIGNYAFFNCSKLTTVNIPSVTSLSGNIFSSCDLLTLLDLPNVAKLSGNLFQNSGLTSLILRKADTIVTGSTISAMFKGTPIASGVGYIYVPAVLVDTYKANSVWSTLANQFRALEDYTIDGTINGALDTTKI